MAKPKVLFLCMGNSCRSQMAEGWLRHLAGDRVEVVSAGAKPVDVNPSAIAVMEEAGIDISQHHSKPVSQFLGQHFSYVITVCDDSRESCPIFPGAFRKLHWNCEDPAAATGTELDRLAVFRRVRDGIGDRVRQFITDELRALAS